MTDIRDIVSQTSAIEKLRAVDLREHETRAAKQGLAAIEEKAVKRESVEETKHTEDKLIRKEQEEKEKREHKESERRAKKADEIKVAADTEEKELTHSEIIEADEGKIIDVKV